MFQNYGSLDICTKTTTKIQKGSKLGSVSGECLKVTVPISGSKRGETRRERQNYPPTHHLMAVDANVHPEKNQHFILV